MDPGTLLAVLAQAIVGAFLIAFGGVEAVKGFKASKWPVTRGRVVLSELEEGPRDRWFVPKWRANIKYTFFVGGKEVVGTHLCVGDQGFGSLWGARRRVARYPQGTAVEVYYDPIAPEGAVLEPGITAGTLVGTLLGAALLAISALLARGGGWRRS